MVVCELSGFSVSVVFSLCHADGSGGWLFDVECIGSRKTFYVKIVKCVEWKTIVVVCQVARAEPSATRCCKA